MFGAVFNYIAWIVLFVAGRGVVWGGEDFVINLISGGVRCLFNVS